MDDAALQPGARLGPYTIVGEIGAGGMGRVYKARDTRLDRTVAIKTSFTTFSERFQREARAIAALNHPHICTIYDIGEADGIPYLASELLEGEPLNQRIHGRPLPPSDAIEFAVQIAAALAAAHAKGIVHRDIKPANIFITSDGRVKLLDFGLAMYSPASETTDLTRTALTEPGTAVGTIAYMSPEQARTESLDARSDLFSFGAVLYEMVTGFRAFRGDSVATIFDAILNQSPRSPSAVAPDTPAEMERIIFKALERDRALRYQSAVEMGADLKRLKRDSTGGVTAAAPSPARGSRPWWPASIAAAIVLAAASLWWTGALGRGTAGPGRVRSIAVLPLANMSAGGGEEYFSDGMTEELIGTVSKISAWRVTSRTSIMQYKGGHKTLPAIARELGVDAVIEGTVQRVGNRVRITARLVDAKTERLLWSDSYDRDVSDVLNLEADVARAIADGVKIAVTPAEQQTLATRKQIDPEVFQLYLKGRALVVGQPSEQKLLQAIGYFDQAIAKDPGYAAAHAGLAKAWANMTPSYRAPKEVMPKARAAAMKAIELDEKLSEAHTELADVLLRFDWNWDGAEKELKRALELNPSSADAHDMYGNYLSALERHQEAIEQGLIARQLDPLSLMISFDIMGNYLNARQYDFAIEEGRRQIAAHPDFSAAYVTVGMAYVMKGDPKTALPMLQKAYELDPIPTVMHFLGMAQAAAGNRAEALKLAAALDNASKTRYICAYEVAELHLSLGETDKAFEWMRKGVAEQCDCMMWLRAEPWIDPMRTDPRYVELMKRVGFPPK